MICFAEQFFISHDKDVLEKEKNFFEKWQEVKYFNIIMKNKYFRIS